MIRIGDYNVLNVARSTSVGIFLEDNEGTEILLPNKYIPTNLQLNQSLEVFCYLDHEERPIATTLKPFVIRDRFAYLKVAQVNKVGAFLDWGLEKQLLVPFMEQRTRLEEAKSYVFHCFLDEQSFRLIASTKIDRFLKKGPADYKVNDQVDILIYRKTDLGWEVIIENTFKGLLFFSDVFKKISAGDSRLGYIKTVREDGKIDISLEPIGLQLLDAAAQRILEELNKREGFLALHDKSAPEEIKEVLQMSKKSFKKGVGMLYKQRKIQLLPNGIKQKN
ncbi:MAG: S1-like domain-containing RNA-binding protein [Bacteroidota bacterium]